MCVLAPRLAGPALSSPLVAFLLLLLFQSLFYYCWFVFRAAFVFFLVGGLYYCNGTLSTTQNNVFPQNNLVLHLLHRLYFPGDRPLDLSQAPKSQTWFFSIYLWFLAQAQSQTDPLDVLLLTAATRLQVSRFMKLRTPRRVRRETHDPLFWHHTPGLGLRAAHRSDDVTTLLLSIIDHDLNIKYNSETLLLLFCTVQNKYRYDFYFFNDNKSSWFRCAILLSPIPFLQIFFFRATSSSFLLL